MALRCRLLVLPLLLVGFVASGCHKSSHSTPATRTTVATTPPTSGSTTTQSTQSIGAATTQATGTTATTAAALTSCATNMLTATLGNGNGAAGTIYYHLVFSNKSSRTCTIQGYPGVSFVDGAGHQIGAPVPRDTNSPVGGVITLGPGSSAGAVFALKDAYVGSVAGCMPTNASGLRVYPPNETAALFVPAPLQVCANVATPGSGSITRIANLADLPG